MDRDLPDAVSGDDGVGVVQASMFNETPGQSAWLLPSYGPARVMYEAAFSPSFHAGGELLIGIGWPVVLGAGVYLVLRRAVGRYV